MASIVVRSGPCAGTRLPLKPGLNHLGRAHGNDCTIPDLSISSRHCEIAFESGQMRVRDLGSTNGTFLDGARISEAIWPQGRPLQLGSVEVLWEAEAEEAEVAPLESAVTRTAAPALRQLKVDSVRAVRVSSPEQAAARSVSAISGGAPPPVSGPVTVCEVHPEVPAQWTCQKCGKKMCLACVKEAKVGSKALQFCRACGGRCVSLQAEKNENGATKRSGEPEGFFDAVSGAFQYPFRGNGLIMLITGSVFFAFLGWLARASRFGMARVGSLMMAVILTGYLFAYMQKIIHSSALAEEEPPDWPEVTDIFSDIIQPCLTLAAIAAFCFAPAMLTFWFMPWLGLLLLVLGAAYFPMALLAVAMADSVSGLNPLVVISAILKVPGPYAATCGVFGLLLIVRTVVAGFLEAALPIPIVPALLIEFVALMLLIVEMRILGLLYFTNRQRLGWFERNY